MEPGVASVSASLLGGVLAVLAPVYGYFRPMNRNEEIKVAERYINRAALHYQTCHSVVIKGERLRNE